jgi:hypothetical protein
MGLLKIPKGGATISLRVPQPNKRLESLRSPERVAVKKITYARAQKNKAAGIPPRKYTLKKVLTINPDHSSSISLETIRKGQGFSVRTAA